MKKTLCVALICVIFILSVNIQSVFAFNNETIEFVFNNRIFEYCLETNIKKGALFDEDFKINQYNRFSSYKERKELLIKMNKLGFEKSVALNYIFPNLNSTVARLEKTINSNATNAELKTNSHSEKVFKVIPEKFGLKVDKQELFNRIFNKYVSNETLIVNVPTIKVNPTVFKSDFEKFINLRADFSTDISSSSTDRKHNIKNAMKALNFVEIFPNQVFSFNKIVGRRTEQNGYRNAKIIVNNEFVDGVGGGVCQVSSTLYNAALLAGLEILEANKHSKQVAYVKYGFDAMVNFGSSDLKIKNNTQQKIIIITNTSSSVARIRLFGESLNGVNYKLKNEIFNVEEPAEEIMQDVEKKHTDKVVYNDEWFYLKKQSKGMEIKSFREKYVNGELVSSELLRHDKFKVQNGVKVYGTEQRVYNLSN